MSSTHEYFIKKLYSLRLFCDKVIKGSAIITTLFLLTSCHFILNQKVSIDPNPNLNRVVKQRNLVRGQITIFDKRTNGNLIGKRFLVLGGSINNYRDTKMVILDKVTAQLDKAGFRRGNGNNLEIDLMLLRYTTDWGFFTFDSTIESEIMVVVTNPNGLVKFRKSYNDKVTRAHFIAPFSWTNQRNINKSLTTSLQKMFDDKDFIRALSVNYF